MSSQKEFTFMEQKSDFMLSPEISLRIPFSRTHLYRLENKGEFPKRIKLGCNRVGWIRTEVEEWIREKMLRPGENQ